MDVSKKDSLVTTEKPFTIHPESNLEVSLTAVTNVAVKVLAEEEHVAEKLPHEWGEVVVLVGTSTAGKTSIISELIKQKPEIIERGIDSAWVSIPLNYLNKNHSKEMAFLERMIEPTKDDIGNYGYILSYIDPPGREPKFKKDVSVREKEQYQEVVKRLNDSLCEGIPGDTSEKYAHSIITCMMDEIILEAKQGRPIACDILQVNEVALETLKIQLPSVKFALVYVPFQTLAERVITRNNEAISEGNFGNARPGVFPLEQFTKLFRPRNESDLDSEIVQKLTLGQVKHAIDTVFENSKTFLESHSPESLDRLEKDTALSRSIILAKFGFKEGDDADKVVELTPSYKGYHMLINTAHGEKSKLEVVQEAVKQILVKG
jgi:hypothetical protein